MISIPTAFAACIALWIIEAQIIISVLFIQNNKLRKAVDKANEKASLWKAEHALLSEDHKRQAEKIEQLKKQSAHHSGKGWGA